MTTSSSTTGIPDAHGVVYSEGMATMILSDAAELLELDASTLRHQIRNGRLKATKLGPVWTVTTAEVERYREANRGRPGRPLKSAPRKRRKTTAPAAGA